MLQTTRNPPGLCISPKTISEGNQKYCSGTTGYAPERILASYCNGTLSPKSKTSLPPLPPAPPSPPIVEEDLDEEVNALLPALPSPTIVEEDWDEEVNALLSALPSPTIVEEDWDEEVNALLSALPSPPIMEEDWEEDTYGFTPYGPDDVPSMALQELNLGHAPGPQQTASEFTPSTQHQAPIRWVHHIRHIVEEQFDDAEG